MKKVLVVAMLFGGLLAKAQTKVYLGARVGGQLSSAYIEHTILTTFITPDFITGYHGGLFAKIFTKKRDAAVNPGFQTGFFLDRKGWGQIFPETEEPKYKVHLTYLQLPMEAAINFGRGKTKTFFTIGWYLDYLVDVNKSADPDPVVLEDNRIDFYTYQSDRDRKLGYGVRFSVGGQRDFSFGAIHIDAFATYNVSSVLDHKSFKTGIPDLTNLYTVGFSLAYLVPFGKLDY
ncbi:PorT family protein [Marinoscillum sp. MHG1-6]|uniref:PorT family protein n=1 Tax=Marinoscillum sp. MHG1-6 TaxID=2959627 RepID=UPI002157F9C3|nr:PorT family protein [Marinoscillum sp. MHG1-6]